MLNFQSYLAWTKSYVCNFLSLLERNCQTKIELEKLRQAGAEKERKEQLREQKKREQERKRVERRRRDEETKSCNRNGTAFSVTDKPGKTAEK